MKKIIFSLLTVLILGLSVIGPKASDKKETANTSFSVKSAQAAVFAEAPVSFYIPKLNKNIEVVAVGLDETNRTPIPEQSNQVAWYKYGGKLGENGSVVLAGHHFWNNNPGVFGGLKDLRVGDKLEVRGETGGNYVFEVKEIETYQRTAFPSEKVYFSSDTQRLTLVTCSGKYDKTAKDYDQRLVIYAVRTS